MTKPEEFVKCDSGYHTTTYYTVARSHKEAVTKVCKHYNYYLAAETALKALDKRKDKRLSVFQVDDVTMVQHMAKRL